jgi:hypothetical protein
MTRLCASGSWAARLSAIEASRASEERKMGPSTAPPAAARYVRSVVSNDGCDRRCTVIFAIVGVGPC